jgi:hypothetical protein
VNEGPNDDLVRVGIIVLLKIPQPLAYMVIYLAGKQGFKNLGPQNPNFSRKKIAESPVVCHRLPAEAFETTQDLGLSTSS